jgi:hypothetical protein
MKWGGSMGEIDITRLKIRKMEKIQVFQTDDGLKVQRYSSLKGL